MRRQTAPDLYPHPPAPARDAQAVTGRIELHAACSFLDMVARRAGEARRGTKTGDHPFAGYGYS
ncbi:hypothetical protein GCM10010177_75360 [Actinomadura citrea]|nr:hypothetical protein GCM10010177_75360 [Actinomadura citrea]